MAGSSNHFPFSVPKEPVDCSGGDGREIAQNNKSSEASKWAPARVTYGRDNMPGKPWRLRQVCQQSAALSVQKGCPAGTLITFLVILKCFNTLKESTWVGLLTCTWRERNQSPGGGRREG